jgi:predicted phage terminase large subunit-like protein
VDCTFKDNKTSDYVVFQAWAKCGGEFYLLDQVRDKMSFTTTATALKAFCGKHPKILRRLVEDKANGTAIIDTLKKEVSGLIPINPKDSKISRVNAVSSLFEAGNIYLPEGVAWLNDLIEESAVFPNGKHDDQVDAMTQALIDLSGARIGSFTEEMLKPTININTVRQGNW